MEIANELNYDHILRNAYLCIVLYFFIEFDLQKMFAKLRDNYRRCVRKRERLSRSGNENNKLPLCNYFEELNFLYDVVSDKSHEISMVYSPPSSTELVASSSWPNYESPHYVSPRHTSPHQTVRINANNDHNEVKQEPMINTSSIVKKRKSYHETYKDSNDLTNEFDGNDPPKTKLDQEQDSDVLFCRSLVQHFKDIKRKKHKKEARIKILQVFLDYDHDSECES